MSTRSDIIVHRADGKWHRVYCHLNGYLGGVGKTLFEHYSSPERAEQLVKPGDISSLGEHCDKPNGHSFATPAEGHTVYYGRDRGETAVAGIVGDSLQEVWPEAGTWAQFIYIWHDGKWSVTAPKDPKHLLDLGDALAGKVKRKALVKRSGW